jgi:tetratricopeptide (TPR) repeat protein
MRFRFRLETALLAILGSAVSLSASYAPLQDPLHNPGFVYFYSNEYDPAIAYFEKQVKARPDDPDVYNHLAQALLYRAFFRSGTLGSALVSAANPFLQRPKIAMSGADKQEFSHAIAGALRLTQADLDKDPKNLRALYAAGIAHGLRANYLFLIEKAWIDSLREATAARNAHDEVLEIDPNFVDAEMIIGLNKYIVGSLPFYMRALGFIGGFHGDKEGGIRDLETVRQKGIQDRYDAGILLAAIYRREHRPQDAIPLLRAGAETFPHNYLFRIEEVEMYGDLGDKQSALRVLNELETRCSSGAPGYQTLPPEKVEYLKGNLLFWYDDLTPALESLKSVTRNPGELDEKTTVMAWLRLGQVYDLQGDREDAMNAYRSVLRLAPDSEAASAAKDYLANRYHRKKKTS